jgi:3-oxoacyl-[acyl-carrier protein] reductase
MAHPGYEIERALLRVSGVPAGRIAHVEEVAHGIAFLCGRLASYITGAKLRIDGGVVPTL